MIVQDKRELFDVVYPLIHDVLVDAKGQWDELEIPLYINGISVRVLYMHKYYCTWIYINDIIRVWDPLGIDGVSNNSLSGLTVEGLEELLWPPIKVCENPKKIHNYKILKRSE